jgi:hypothetical protein
VEVTPERVIAVDPPEAVVSEVRAGERVGDVRADLCSRGHFFPPPQSASAWLEGYPQGRVSTVEDDFELHKEVLDRLNGVKTS